MEKIKARKWPDLGEQFAPAAPETRLPVSGVIFFRDNPAGMVVNPGKIGYLEKNQLWPMGPFPTRHS